MARCAVLGLVLLLGFATVASAEGQLCTAHLLNDDYGVQITGTRPSAPGPLAPTEQVIGGGMAHFDGRGGYALIGFTHGSVTGIDAGRSGTGTYTVNADCTGTITFQNAGTPFPITVTIVIVDGGNEIRGATTDPANLMVSAIWRKK